MSMESKHAPSSPGLSLCLAFGGLAFMILLSPSLQLGVLSIHLLWETYFFDSLHPQICCLFLTPTAPPTVCATCPVVMNSVWSQAHLTYSSLTYVCTT